MKCALSLNSRMRWICSPASAEDFVKLWRTSIREHEIARPPLKGSNASRSIAFTFTHIAVVNRHGFCTRSLRMTWIAT